MNEAVRRVFVENRPGFDVEAQNLLKALRNELGIASLKGVRIFKRYDFSGVSDSRQRFDECNFVQAE